jgi:hypothetical protein
MNERKRVAIRGRQDERKQGQKNGCEKIKTA